MLAVLLVSALLPTILLYQIARTADFTMDSPAALLPRDGMYRREEFPAQAGFFSWTDGSSSIKPPNPGGTARMRIEMLSPSHQPLPTRIQVGASTVAFDVRPEPRTYMVLLPASARERISLTIDSRAIKANKRMLGGGVSDI